MIMNVTEVERSMENWKKVETQIDKKGSLCSILNVDCSVIQNVNSTEYPQLTRFMIVDCDLSLLYCWEIYVKEIPYAKLPS